MFRKETPKASDRMSLSQLIKELSDSISSNARGERKYSDDAIAMANATAAKAVERASGNVINIFISTAHQYMACHDVAVSAAQNLGRAYGASVMAGKIAQSAALAAVELAVLSGCDDNEILDAGKEAAKEIYEVLSYAEATYEHWQEIAMTHGERSDWIKAEKARGLNDQVQNLLKLAERSSGPRDPAERQIKRNRDLVLRMHAENLKFGIKLETPVRK